MKKMKILLIEDDTSHCKEYMDLIVRQSGIHMLHTANGCTTGLELIRNNEFDIVLLDLELNNSDGDGIQFLRELRKVKMKKRPYIIVITVITSDRTHSLARQCGADFVFTKSKPDYSPQLVINFAYNCFLGADNEVICINPAQSEEHIRVSVRRELESIGITYNMDGMAYLIDSIYIAVTHDTGDLNLRKDIYPVLARKYKKSDQSIEKAIRNAINKAWRETDLTELARHYTVELSYITATPKPKEFICYYAEKFRA